MPPNCRTTAPGAEVWPNDGRHGPPTIGKKSANFDTFRHDLTCAGQVQPTYSQSRTCFGQCWPTSAAICNNCPSLVKIRQRWQNRGRARPNSAMCSPIWGGLGQLRHQFNKYRMLPDSERLPQICQRRQNQGRARPNSAIRDPIWANLGQMRRQLTKCQMLPDLASVCPPSNLGQTSAPEATLTQRLGNGQLRSSPGSPGIISREVLRANRAQVSGNIL